jgi:hypothetical protein
VARATGHCVCIAGVIGCISIRSICSTSQAATTHWLIASGVADEDQQLIGTLFGAWDTAVVTPASVAAASTAPLSAIARITFVVAGWPAAKRE